MYETLARMRPAIVVARGELRGELTPAWSRVLTTAASKTAVSRASKATGLFRLSNPRGSAIEPQAELVGFAIARNIIATADYNILLGDLRSTEGPGVAKIPANYTAEFFFTDEQPSNELSPRSHRIKRVLFTGKSRAGSRIALLEIEGHDEQANPGMYTVD